MRFWFQRKKSQAAVEQPRPTCHGCQSSETEMVVPVSPEVPQLSLHAVRTAMVDPRSTQADRSDSVKISIF